MHTRLAATLAACLLAAPALADAQGYTSLNRVYTLSGCLEGISCYTVTMSVYDLRLATELAPRPLVYPHRYPTDGGVWQALGYRVLASRIEPGAGLAPVRDFGFTVPYAYTSATGASTAPLPGDPPAFASMCNAVIGNVAQSCNDWWPGLQGGWISNSSGDRPLAYVTPDWSPAAFFVQLVTGDPGPQGWRWATRDDSRVTLRLSVTDVQTTAPEPGTIALTATGLLALCLVARRRPVDA